MPSKLVVTPDAGVRKRRTHAKSRKGCGNCKLRRVKCDEARPACKKCLSYGVSCTYDLTKATLDLSAEGAFQIELPATDASRTEFRVDDAFQSNFLVDGPFPVGLPSESAWQIDFPTSQIPEPTKPATTNSAMGLTTPQIHKQISVNQTIITAMNNALHFSSAGQKDMPESWAFSQTDIETFQRFKERTIMTIGTTRTGDVYREHIGPLAFRYPFLMRIILSLTHMHDAHLAFPSDSYRASKSTNISLQNWAAATQLFKSVLSGPIAPESRDALWATAALNGSTVFSYVEAPSIYDCWPLKPPEPGDLNWLKLSEGKKAIWKIAQPNRPDSIFSEAIEEHNFYTSWVDDAVAHLSQLPSHIKKLFNVEYSASSPELIPESPGSASDNPYEIQLLILLRLLALRQKGHICTLNNSLQSLHFIAYMPVRFKELLEEKDSRALLLLRWWYQTLEDSELWWLTRRAKIQGMAIEVWLERESRVMEHHGVFDFAGASCGATESYRQPVESGGGHNTELVNVLYGWSGTVQ